MKKLNWVSLIALDVFLSVGGFVGGLSFIFDSSGAGLGADPSWLEKSPVDNFLLPGIYILIIYAIAPIVLLVLNRTYRKAALLGNALVGFSLIPWIFYQFIVVPERIFIQYLMLGVGAVISILSIILMQLSSKENIDSR